MIIQFEEELQIHQNVEKLVARHPNSLVIQYNVLTGESRLVYGDPQAMIGDNIHWFLAGHCRGDLPDINATFGGATPAELSRALSTLCLGYSLKPPAQIVLAAKNSDSFAMKLSNITHHQALHVPVRAYRTAGTMSIAGYFLTMSDTPDDLWLAKNSYLRVDYSRAIDGPVMANAVPVALTIVDDIYIGVMPLNRAIREYADILQYYFSTPDGQLDKQRLTDTVSNYHRYEKFVRYIEMTLDDPDSSGKNFNLWLTTPAGSASRASEENNRSNNSLRLRPEPLEKRINNTRMIMDKLAAGSIKLTELNSHERHYLSDFFQRSDGTLDSRRLMLTVASERDQQAFYNELHDLLQLADHRLQRNGLSGQDILQRSKSWNNHLSENIVSLQQATDNNNVPAVTCQMRITLHTLYLHDGSAEVKRQVTNTSRAWLYALSLGDLSQQRFLNGLNTYSEINELQASESLSRSEVQQSRQFHQLINELHNTRYLDQYYVTDKGKHTLDAWLPQLTGNGPDSYFQLLSDNHVFGLAKRTTGDQQSWYLYNPDLGEVHLTSQHPIQTLQVLKTLLYDYLNSKSDAWNNQTLADYYGVQRSGEQLSFVIHEINMTKAADVPALNSLQKLLDNDFSTERQRLKNSGDIKLGTLTLPRQTLYEMGASLDGHRVSATLNLPATSLNRLRFDPLVLTRYLAVTPQQSTLPALRLLKQSIAAQSSAVKGQILTPHNNADATAEAFRLLDKIEQHKGDEQQLSSQLSALLNKPDGHHHRWQRINQMTHGTGQITQAYSYFQALSTLSDYWQATNNKNVGREERQELALQAGMALGQISLDIGVYGLNKISQHLTKKAAQGLVSPGSRLGRLNFTTGAKLAKFGGTLLSIASSGFDIYDVWRYFSQADNPSPRLRQDMQVHGSLSLLSAAVGISTTLAIAAGGTIMSVGSAIGVLMGIAIIIAGHAYAAASQIAAIKKYIALSPGEELRNGWLLFTGQDMDTSLHNRLTAAQAHEETRNDYTRQLKEQAETLLAESLFSKGIDTYFYSKGTFDLKEYTYKKLMGRTNEYRVSGSMINSMEIHHSSKNILKDRIYPQEAEATKQRYKSMMNGNIPLHTDMSIEDSEYHFYVPTPLKAVKDSVSADDNQLSDGAAKAVFQPPQPEEDKPQEMAALFDLHDDDDSALGYRDKKNIFMVQSGQKRFSGGQLADTFLLMGQPAPFHASELDGSYRSSDTTTELPDNNDTVIVSASPGSGVGYSIDLTKGEVRYLSDADPLVTRLSHIEHAMGHATTDDTLTGNQHNNALNGAGGLDKLYGNAGDDVLTLAAGYAEGGSGIDTYCILQNLQSHDASIRIKDIASRDEINNIRLDYKAAQIKSIEQLSSDSVTVTLSNNNATLTTLTLSAVYQHAGIDNQRNRVSEYILYTLDGMLLFPQWPRTITQDKQGRWSFSPTLIGQYNPLLDHRWQEKFSKKKSEEILIQLQRQASTGRGLITVDDSQIVLPEFIQLATEGTPLNDQLEGDQQSNWLRGYQGNDRLIGKGGSDVYEIYENDGQYKQRYTITIDNKDDSQQPDVDFLLIKQSINEIITEQEGNDLILRPFDPNSRSAEIRIQNFMSDERNRHLMLIDKSGGSYHIELNELKQPYLKDNILQAEPGPDNDYLVLSALTGATVNALAGDDVIVDKTGIGRTLHGDLGDDIIIVTAGNNLLYGEEGNDQLYGGAKPDTLNGGSGNDQLSGGPGNDILQDFQGDDVYLFSPGDGEDIIRDVHGTDRLRFLGDEIDKNSLWFERRGDHLAVLVSARNSGDNVKLEGYFSKSQDKASNIIEVAGYQLCSADITALTQIMSDFPVFELNHMLTGAANRVQENINKLWSAVTE